MKVNLYLMSAKGLGALRSAISRGFSDLINEVCIGRDCNVLNDFSQEIRELSESSGISWRYRDQESIKSGAEYSIAISWRWLLKNVPRLIIIHDSLLPKYRGFAPLVSQLINGESQIGVSAIWAGEDYDTGDVIAQSSISISYPIKIQQAIDIITQCYNNCFIYILQEIAKNSHMPSTPQDHKHATYSLWRDEQDYWINWNDSSERIARFIDAVGTPYKGARSLCNGDKIIIREANLIPDLIIENRRPGKVLRLQNGFPVVVCGSGLLMIEDGLYKTSGLPLLPLKSFRTRFSQPRWYADSSDPL